MKSFKKFLTESVSKPESVQRLIYSQPPSPHDEPLYNQIVTRPTQPNFSWKATDRKIDPVVQASWADPRKGLVGYTDKAWDFSDVGTAKLADVKAASPAYQKGYTAKRYYSLKGSENLDTLKKFSAAMPDFHKRMGALADQFKTGFSYKVPHHPSVAATHTDTLVVHHYDVPDSSLSRSIDATTKKWAADHGIEFLDRQGCEEGMDCKIEGSHTQRMAKAIKGGAKGSLAQISKNIVDSSVAKLSGQTNQSATQTFKNIGAGGLAVAGAITGSALTQGVQAATDVLGMLGTTPMPKDRMQVEKTFNSDIGMGFNLSPEGELEADPQGREAARKRQQRGVNFGSMFRG